MSPVAGRSATKQETVYRELRGRILDGKYSPGFRIVIDQIAGELDVSALPVREAIRRLEAEGLVIYRPNAGAQVAPADPDLFEEEMTTLALLEGYATALAAPTLDEQAQNKLNDITDSMEAAMLQMDILLFSKLNREFHAEIHAACKNKSLVRMIDEVGRRLDAIRSTVFVQIPLRGADSVAEHRNLVQLIADGADSAVIEQTARAHKLQTVETFKAWRESNHG